MKYIHLVSLIIILWSAALAHAYPNDATAEKNQKFGTVAQSSKQDDKQLNHLIKAGDKSMQEGKLILALTHYSDAYELALKHKHHTDQIFLAAQIGNCKDLMGELNSALEWYSKALNLSYQMESKPSNLSYIHNNLGNLYLKIGSFSKSLEHYQAALDLKLESNDEAGIANALLNFSIYYLRTGNYKRTLEYQRQALQIRQKLGDQNLIASSYSSISVTYRHLEDYTKAFDYIHKALTIYQQQGNKSKIASSYNNLGVLYLFTNDLQRAKEYYLKSYELKKDSSDVQSKLSSLTNLLDISLKLNQLSEAANYLNQARNLQGKSQFYELNRTLHKLSSEYYERTRNYKMALECYKLYHALSDSLASEQKSKLLSEMEVKYEVQDKERNIELLTKNNELSQLALKRSSQLRDYLILILFLGVLVVIVLVWRYYSVLRLNRKINSNRESLNLMNQELEKRVAIEVANRQEQEQKALRQSRLAILGELAAGIAHELNQPMQTLSLTLENIMTAIQENRINADYLEQKMSYLFEDISRMHSVIEHIRRFSKQSHDPEHSTFKLSESITNAVLLIHDQIQKHQIEIKLNLCKESIFLKGSQYKFEHVILNLLANAKDAINEKLEKGEIQKGLIEIQSEIGSSGVQVAVVDNGCGIPPEIQEKVFDIFFSTKSLEKGTGLGLAIASGIVKSMNASLHLVSKPGSGTRFSIRIPQSEYEIG